MLCARWEIIISYSLRPTAELEMSCRAQHFHKQMTFGCRTKFYNGTDVTLFLHITSFTKNDKKYGLFSYLRMYVWIITPKFNSWQYFMCEKCHVWSIVKFYSFSHQTCIYSSCNLSWHSNLRNNPLTIQKILEKTLT